VEEIGRRCACVIVGFGINIFWDPCQLCIESGRTFFITKIHGKRQNTCPIIRQLSSNTTTVSGISFVSTSRLTWIIDKDKTGHPTNNLLN